MAAKKVKATATSATKRATFKRVNKRIASVFTPVQSNAARMRATNKLQRAKAAGTIQGAKYRGGPPNLTHSSYYGMAAALRRQQQKYLVSRQATYAMQRSTRMNQQLSRGNWARKQAARRSSLQQFRTIMLFGSQKGMQNWVTHAAGGTPLPRNIASVSARTRNTSAAARVQQSIRAQKANSTRRGSKYKKGGGSSGSGRTSAPRITYGKRSTTGMHPTKALATPKAAPPTTWVKSYNDRTGSLSVPDTSWITAGNDKGAENCAAVAVANHLWYHEGLRLSDEQVNDLARHGETIPALLRYLRGNEAFENAWPGSWRLTRVAGPGDLVVYAVGRETHAALLLENLKAVSWGEEVSLKQPITEAWGLKWRTYRRSGRL